MSSLKKSIEIASTFTYPDEARVKAIEDLAEYPVREVFGVVAKCAIVDNSPAVRRKAIDVLQGISPQAAHETFLKHLHHKNPRVLERAIQALRQLAFNLQRTKCELVKFLDHQDHRVRNAAQETINKLGSPSTQATSGNRARFHVVGRRAAYL